MVKILIQGLEVETERNINGLDPMNNALDNEAYLDQERSLKLGMLREFTALQACDDNLWRIVNDPTVIYLHHELRRLTYLIEEATVEQIQTVIDTYKCQLGMFFTDV